MLAPCLVLGQDPQLPINSETRKVEYSDLVKVDSILTRDQLFTRAREWMVSTFKTSKDVLQIDDKGTGTIMGKCNLEIKDQTHLRNGYIMFSVKIQVKDGRFKYWVNDLEHFTFSGLMNGGSLDNEKPSVKPAYMSTKTWGQIKSQAGTDIPELIKSLKAQMSKPVSANSDNW